MRMRRLLVGVLAFWGCDDGGSSADAFTGRFEVTGRETRAACDDSAPWVALEVEDPRFFRLAPIQVFGDPFLGYFVCSDADTCADNASLGLSFSRAGGAWVSQRGDLGSTPEGCALEMRAGPLEPTADGLVLVVSHHQGTLDLTPEACTVDVLESRYAELPCLDQVRWTARRLP